MTRDPRPWTYAALFGALWGTLEASLGTMLQLGQVPMGGMVMSSLGVICLITLRRLQPRVGVCLIAGAAAVFLKVFTIGGLYPGPLIGISLQAIAVEAAFTVTFSRAPGAVIGGALAVASSPLQKFVKVWIVAGPEAVRSAVQGIQRLSGLAGLPQLEGVTMLILLVCVAAALGGVVGSLAWVLAGRVLQRIGRSP
jgi:hypothetical protein